MWIGGILEESKSVSSRWGSSSPFCAHTVCRIRAVKYKCLVSDWLPRCSRWPWCVSEIDVSVLLNLILEIFRGLSPQDVSTLNIKRDDRSDMLLQSLWVMIFNFLELESEILMWNLKRFKILIFTPLYAEDISSVTFYVVISNPLSNHSISIFINGFHQKSWFAESLNMSSLPRPLGYGLILTAVFFAGFEFGVFVSDSPEYSTVPVALQLTGISIFCIRSLSSYDSWWWMVCIDCSSTIRGPRIPNRCDGRKPSFDVLLHSEECLHQIQIAVLRDGQ